MLRDQAKRWQPRPSCQKPDGSEASLEKDQEKVVISQSPSKDSEPREKVSEDEDLVAGGVGGNKVDVYD